MTNTGMTKEKLVGWLEENKASLEALITDSNTSSKMRVWFGLSETTKTITDKKIVDFVDANYDKIFK